MLAKTLKWQIKAVLVNSIAADFVNGAGSTVYYIGYLICANSVNDSDGIISCRIADGFNIAGFLSSLAAVTLYAVAVYIFIKYGISTLWPPMSVQHGYSIVH